VSDEQIAQVVDELSTVVERLDEIAFAALRDAVAGGESCRPEVERRVVRARNAIERARRILEGGRLQGRLDDQP
jgi:hypothetical protein